MGERNRHDVLIIGSGAAGLAAALHLSPHAKIAVLSKDELDSGSTDWAQGGIAAVTDPVDSEYEHVQDTLHAGAGLCREKTVWHVVCHAREAIAQLIRWGVAFDRDGNDFHLTQEGGHSFRRVLHVADATGHAVSSNLIREARAAANIEMFANHVAIDLITTAKLGAANNRCVGAYVYNQKTDHVEVFEASCVILATGGASKVYLYTSNPDGSTGDGIAMAWRAGCRVANMEFNQFHPTCLFHPHAKSFLITEAVRGEGGILRLPDGERFMPKFDARAELAPRDVVARAIDHEMKRLGADCVYLDISHKPECADQEALPQHFRYVCLARHRHHARTDTGRAGRSLHVRRRRRRSERCSRRPRSLRHRRSEFHRTARREPPGEQFAARMSRVRQGGRGPHSNATACAPRRLHRFPTGTKAASKTPTKTS